MFRNAKTKLYNEIDNLQEVNALLKKQVESLQEIESRTNNLMSENMRLSAEVKSLKAELISAKNKIRKQTEADLLLNALKSVGLIPETTEEKPDYFATDLALRGQLSQQASGNLGAIGGMLGGLR